MLGNDSAFLRSMLGNCNSLTPPSTSSANYKSLGLKYSLEYVIFVRDPRLGNPVLYFGMDSLNLIRSVKRGTVQEMVSN